MILDGGTHRAQGGERTYIWVYARDVANAGVTGASIVLRIQRIVDTFWWDDTNSVFQPLYAGMYFIEADPVNSPGLYYYIFAPRVTDFVAIAIGTTATAGVVNAPFVGEIIVGNWVDNIDAAISSRGSSTIATTTQAQIGGSFIDDDLTRLHSLYSVLRAEQVKGQDKITKRLDAINEQLKK